MSKTEEMRCKKHNMSIVSVYALASSSYGNFLCEKCKEDIGESILSLLRPSLYTVPEFLEKQNTPGFEKKFLTEVHSHLIGTQVTMREISSSTDSMVKDIESDFAVIYKTFMGLSDTSKKYFRHKVQSSFKDQMNRYKFLISEYKKIDQRVDQKGYEPIPSCASTEELITKIINRNNQMNQLKTDILSFQSEVNQSEKKVIKYKRNEKIFQEFNSYFNKYVKEFFRKFKIFLEEPNPSKKQGELGIDQESMLLDMSKNLGQLGNKSFDLSGLNDSILTGHLIGHTSMPVPQANPKSRIKRKLERFPEINNEAMKAALKEYGSFQGKSQNPEFKNLGETFLVELNDGSIYQGCLKDEKRWGRGRCIMPSGIFIDGFWANDFPEDCCRVIHQNGDVFEGKVKEGKSFGKGVFVTLSKYRFVGEWVNSRRNGLGEETTPEGTTYKGQFLNDKKHGMGELTTKDGMKYKGNFTEGVIDGFGTATWLNGCSYSGEWANGKKSGTGKYCFKNGDVYEGDFVQDAPHGLGKMTQADGSVVIGPWVDGKPHGLLGYQKGQTKAIMEVQITGEETKMVQLSPRKAK